MELSDHAIVHPLPEPKRRKIAPNENLVRPITPCSPHPSEVPSDICMDIDTNLEQDTNNSLMSQQIHQTTLPDENCRITYSCPCGYLHGEGEHDDLKAVGLAQVPLLRGAPENID